MVKRSKLAIGGAALLAVGLLVSTQVVSQEKGPAKEEGQGNWMEMMAKWQAMGATGPEHKKLVGMVGTWETESRMWMMPGMEPIVSKGTAEIRLIFDGRFIEQRYKCGEGEQAFEGLGYEGYDRIKKQYVSVWLDSQSTGIFMSYGQMDESGKVCTYHGKMDDPFTGEKDKVVKSVAREINKDKAVFEMYDKRPGVGEFKSMEITYTRKK